MPPEDDVLLAEEQPLPAALSPTADSLGYVAESDPEEDHEEDPVDYPINGDDDNDDDESSNDDKDDDDDVEEDEDEEVDRLLAISTPPPSPLTPLSLPLPQIPSPPLPASPTHSLGYRAAMIRLRAESPSTSYPLPLPSPIVLPYTMASMAMMRAATPSTYILAPPSGTPPLLPIPLPTSSPPLLLPSTAVERMFPRPTEGFRVDYGFVGTLDDEIRRDPERDDTNEIYGRLDDAHDDRVLMISQLNMLRRYRCSHARTSRLMEAEARLSREA
ncbi:hypothetical protein Tco_0668925 [Tanacetum coccineum]